MHDYDEIAHIAQNISHSIEDSFFDDNKKNMFDSIFNRYLKEVDPDGNMESYYAIIKLGLKDKPKFTKMVEELKVKGLIS